MRPSPRPRMSPRAKNSILKRSIQSRRPRLGTSLNYTNNFASANIKPPRNPSNDLRYDTKEFLSRLADREAIIDNYYKKKVNEVDESLKSSQKRLDNSLKVKPVNHNEATALKIRQNLAWSGIEELIKTQEQLEAEIGYQKEIASHDVLINIYDEKLNDLKRGSQHSEDARRLIFTIEREIDHLKQDIEKINTIHKNRLKKGSFVPSKFKNRSMAKSRKNIKPRTRRHSNVTL
jgi:hypothetical protein